jgi:hypothetical protein
MRRDACRARDTLTLDGSQAHVIPAGGAAAPESRDLQDVEKQALD